MNGNGNETKAAAVPTAGVASAQQRQQLSLRYVDQPDLKETFADSIGALSFDGQSLRIEFTVTRMDEVKPNAALSGRRYPACRLVLPPMAAAELINKMQQIGAALAQAGVMKAAPAKGKEEAEK
jgi:hypothetical protein